MSDLLYLMFRDEEKGKNKRKEACLEEINFF